MSSAEDGSNIEADQESVERSETNSADDVELKNNVEENAGVPLDNASSEESLTGESLLEAEDSLDSEEAMEQNTDSDVSTQGETGVESVSYKTRVQDEGWQDWKKDGELSGTTGKSKGMEARQSGTVGESKKLEGIRVRLSSGIDGTVQYRTYTENDGWEAWSENGEINGKPDGTRRLEAIQIRLTGEAAEKYDIYYRVHCQDYGWLGWAKNGEKAGSEPYSRRMEAIEVKLVTKGNAAPGNTNNCFCGR